MPPPASRPLGAQRSRPLTLPVLTPEKPSGRAEELGRLTDLIRTSLSLADSAIKTGHVGSQKLDVPRHFFGGRNAAQEDQVEHDLPQSSVSRWPKDNPCVRPASFGQRDEVTVARHQHAALRMSERQLLQVGGALEFLLDGGRHIDSPQPEASGNGGIDVLVEVVGGT